jgi:hypothetical protein
MGRYKIVLLFFLLIADPERREYFTLPSRMLAIHFLYAKYGWKDTSLESVEYSVLAVPDVLQLVQVSRVLLYSYIVNYKS